MGRADLGRLDRILQAVERAGLLRRRHRLLARAIDYADQSCGGTLQKVGEKGSTSFYVETITRGGVDPATGHGCLNGNVILIKSGDALAWGWIGEHKGQALSATAILARKP